jgi:hypothetical protein
MMYEIEALPRTQIYFSHSARTALHWMIDFFTYSNFER